MGRLKGVVLSLGMQVSFLLSYLWQYPLTQPLPEGVPVAELSQEDLKNGRHRFRRYRQDMTVEQQALFPQVKVDGRGQAQFFVKCWEGLQLLFKKVTDRGRVLAFWNDHGSELQELFPPPSSSQLPSQKGEELVHELRSNFSPILNESVTSMEAMLDGTVHITVLDWPSFLLFKSEYQACTSTEYYSHNTMHRGGMTVKHFYCRRGGKTPWEIDGDVSSECGRSIKGCGCTANIKTVLHPLYAKEMNVGSPKLQNDKEADKAYSTAVHICIQAEHTGHNPDDDRDVNMLSTDDRVKNQIREYAKSPNLTAQYVKTEVHKFSEKLVENLQIPRNSTQFFPNEPTIKKLMKQFREHLRRDPHDHIAVQKLIDQDVAANPEHKWHFRAGDGPAGTVPMLLVHQTPFQREMLAKYGGTIVGMDATYRTNQWGLPMILVVVASVQGSVGAI